MRLPTRKIDRLPTQPVVTPERTMAVTQLDDVSDDDFDIIEPAHPVSEPSSPNYHDAAAHPHHANIDTTNNTNDTRQFPDGLKPLDPTPLEAHAGTEQTNDPRQPPSLPMFPPQPFVQDTTHEDALAPLASQGGDQGRTLSPNNHHTADQSRSSDGGSDSIPGLKYTKSVYQKFWGGKDALIAVMG